MSGPNPRAPSQLPTAMHYDQSLSALASRIQHFETLAKTVKTELNRVRILMEQRRVEKIREGCPGAARYESNFTNRSQPGAVQPTVYRVGAGGVARRA